MKIVYFGCDAYMECLDVFLSHDHDILAIFTTGDSRSNKNIIEYAKNKRIQCINKKPTKLHIQMFEAMGANCFYSCEYQYIIPLPSPEVLTLNVHPTLLPHGRGPTPLFHLILQYPEFAGITFHKLSNQFDEGDVIFQSPINIDKDECLESLIVKLHYLIPHYLEIVLNNLSKLYENSIPQCAGSFWPKKTLQDRLLNWHDNIEKINLMIRAFGQFGVITYIVHEAWLVNHVITRKINHSNSFGTIITHDHKTCVIAVSEGIVIIYKDSILESYNHHLKAQ